MQYVCKSLLHALLLTTLSSALNHTHLQLLQLCLLALQLRLQAVALLPHVLSLSARLQTQHTRPASA